MAECFWIETPNPHKPLKNKILPPLVEQKPESVPQKPESVPQKPESVPQKPESVPQKPESFRIFSDLFRDLQKQKQGF